MSGTRTMVLEKHDLDLQPALERKKFGLFKTRTKTVPSGPPGPLGPPSSTIDACDDDGDGSDLLCCGCIPKRC